MSDLTAILADLRATHRWPTEHEVELVIAEGDYAQVSGMLVYTACTDKRLARKRVEAEKEREMRRQRGVAVSVKDGMKVCARCRASKPVSDFHFMKAKGFYASYCKPCKGIIARELRERLQARDVAPQTIARFWAKVEKTATCWNWTGGTGYLGYGRFMYRGKLEQAHRVSLILSGIEVPSRKETGMVVDHVCKNSACVNPAHLRIVSHEDNCTVLANPTPFYRNRLKTACPKGHQYSGENLAIYRHPTKGLMGRMCLTCYPHYWRYAAVPRSAPPNAKPTRKEKA